MSISEVSLRPVLDVDRAFLRTLYGTTRAAEMALLPWPQAAIDVFLDQQFQAQHDYYQAQFADADFFIIEVAGEPIGRVYLHWTDSHVQFIDMALLPAWCGRGIGSRLLDLMAQHAADVGVRTLTALTLTESWRVRRMLERLGTTSIRSAGTTCEVTVALPASVPDARLRCHVRQEGPWTG